MNFTEKVVKNTLVENKTNVGGFIFTGKKH